MSKNNNRHRWNKRKNYPTEEQPPFEVGKVWGAPKTRKREWSLRTQELNYRNNIKKYIRNVEYDGDTIGEITCPGRYRHIVQQIKRIAQLRRDKGEWETS